MDRVRVGVLTRNPEAWCSQRLQEALTRIGAEPVCFGFRGLIARVRLGPTVSTDGVDILRDLDAIVVRPIGRGSLEEIVFRMDVLYRLQRQGLYIINRPDAIEKAVDKYRALTILEENGVPVPRTIAAESPRNALEAFNELGGDVIVKSIFGSRGVGMTRVNDPEVAIRVFNTLALYHHVIYIQEFIPHGASDIGAFVLGD
ncbi:TPA: ATP-grasp domain-containing protein, partial [Candidatus Bathyarchaeota archaeon]|nr:ATP-grasp domain-containing protein [Candidatus Bathyarchaeota archaeon]